MQHTSSTDESASLTRNSSRSSSSSSKGSIIKATLCKTTCLTMEPDAKEHKCSMECIDKYPIHHAARQGSFRRLKLLLEDPACSKCPLGPDECLGRTPLHYAVSTGNVEKGLVCTKMLLECRQLTEHANAAEKIKGYVNHLDFYGKTALHLAAKNEATQIVIELLTNQADFDISSDDGSCALREIYKNTPIAMEEALNQSISYVEKCSRPTLPSDNVSVKNNEFDFTRTCVNVCLDFYPVIGSKITKDQYEEFEANEKCPGKSARLLCPETGFLFTVNRKRMQANVRRQILTNALVQAFLHFKWQKVKWFCFTAIYFHAIWLLLYIGTVINVFVMQCAYKAVKQDEGGVIENQEENETILASSLEMEEGTRCHTDLITQITAGLLLIMSTMVTFKEIFQFIRLGSLYIRFENFGQIALLSFIIVTIPPIYFWPVMHISSLHFQMSAFGVCLAWTLLLCQLAKLPRFILRFEKFGRRGMLVFPDHGIYVEILSRVFKNFLIFITIFSSLLISFVFSFNILLPNSQGFVNLSHSMVKVLTMMTGELNYDDIFQSDVPLRYPFSSHLMYAMFIMVATIILFNLLIGFTVSDIQGLQKDAEINQISNKLEQIFLMECFLLSGTVQKFVAIIGRLINRKTYKFFDRIMVVRKRNSSNHLCFHTMIKVLPTPLRVKVRNLASKNCMALADICGVTRSKMFGAVGNRNFEH